MKYGISSSALYGRLETDQALAFLRDSGQCECAEVFFQCPDEYRGNYMYNVIEAARGLNVVSMHMLSSSFEFMMFSASERGREYALRETFEAIHTGHMLGAKGGHPGLANADTVARALRPVVDELKRSDMVLALENVSWSEFSCPEFGSLIAEKLPEVRFTLDNKQAVRAGYDYHEYMEAMGDRLDHVHVYDFDDEGHECLPGKGHVDFARFGDELRERDYDGAVIIEAYPNMYRDKEELLEALESVKKTMGRG